MIVEQRFDEPRDQLEFPIGMRVLAVDDEPTCLLLLETLLRRCQYHVTTTNQAVTALKMLRENKDTFDLVISDVHMPDMDGFRLLELVGLEMDLPVIMLSGNDDPRLVMKGITHGACDYLLKPIRLEELKTIWQHVIRRKKLEPKGKRNSNKPYNGSTEGGHGSTGALNKKRKDQNEDDEDEHDENAQENEDLSTQKKPRVVWSVELHHKFVAAVHQLGIDKAVPKKILELMNEENLSRENVASHLQKYRLYLRKFSHVASQQANMVTAFGSSIDSNYLRMLSLNGLGNYNTLSGSHLQNATFNTFSQKGMLGRLNSPDGLGVRGLSTSGMVQLQLAQSRNTTFPNTDLDKFSSIILLGNQNENILQGMPLSIDCEQIKDCTNVTTMGFSASGGLSDTKVPIVGSQNSFVGASNNPVKENFSSELTSHSPIDVRCSENWSNAVQSSEMQYLNVPFKQSDLSSNGFKDNTTQVNQLIGNQTAPHMTGSMPQKIEYTLKQGWNNQKLNFSNRSNPRGSGNSINFGNAYSLDQILDPKIKSFHSNVGFNLTGQPNFDYSLHMQHNGMGNSAMNITVRPNQGQGQGQPQGGHSYNNFGSLEDLVSAVMKKEQKKTTKMDEDFGNDEFSLETFR